MRQSTTDIVDEYRLRNVLMACLLTTCTECYQGNFQEAVKSATTGIKLLFSFLEWRHATSVPGPRAGTSVIEADLVRTYSSLKLLIWKATGQGDLMDSKTSPKSNNLNIMPEEFLSLKQARMHWNISCRRPITWSSVRSLHMFQKLGRRDRSLSSTPEATPRGSLPVTETELDGWLGDENSPARKNNRWANAFKPLFSKCRSMSKTTKDFQGATILMLKHLSLKYLDQSFDVYEEQVVDAKSYG
jgi:hypothetical protein